MKRFTALFIIVFSTTYAEYSNIDLQALLVESKPETVVDIKNTPNAESLKKKDPRLAGGFNELLEYLLPSPYQANAGSCLFMTHTGTIEWWINKLYNLKGEQRVDLSERHIMSLKTKQTNQDKVSNWRTDTIYRVNKDSLAFENDAHRFTKGNYKVVDGVRVVTDELDPEAIYGVKYNWIVTDDGLNSGQIELPKFKRNVLLVDEEKNQWNVAKAPLDIARKVKEALVKYKAPVQVIYNHKGFLARKYDCWI